MSCDITLVNLNMLFLKYSEKIDREIHVPLGLLYLTSVLEDSGYKVDFRDYQIADTLEPFDFEVFLDFLKDSEDIVGFSCMSNLLPFTLLAASIFKKRYPNKTILLGGVGPFSLENKILMNFPWIDIIAYGECEKAIVPLLRALQDKKRLEDVLNIYFRNEKGEIVRNPPAPRFENPDEIPFPAFHKIDIRKYEGYGVMTSRGCPYNCTFCSVAPIWGRKTTIRSNKSVIEEMCLLNERTGNDLFLFQDEFFLCSKERAKAFSEDLIKSGKNLRWKAFGRINLTDNDSMQTMAASGCIELRFGIECGSNSMLERINKGFTIEEANSVISRAVQIFNRVDSFFIWGFPFETMKDFYKTLFTMISYRLMGSRILPSLFTFLPQSDIYLEYKDKGKFEFYPRLIPEYMLTGHEIIRDGYTEVDKKYKPIFDFIEQNPDIFPGFFTLDVQDNLLPKLKALQEHGFYASEETTDKTSSDSCGAHSPKIETDSRQEIFTRAVTHAVNKA